MRSFRPRIQTGRAPGSNRASPGFKPGEPRIQTGRAPGSNQASPGIKPGEPPEKDCQICQKCQTPGGEKRASKASVLSGSLSLWRVFSQVKDGILHFKSCTIS